MHGVRRESLTDMTSWPTARIRGQESYLLTARQVQLAMTVLGGHLAPVTFFPGDPHPVQPYAIAPWATEALPAGTPPLVRTLRGDFFCSAFGANTEPVRGRHLPLHGETANVAWQPLARGETNAGCWMHLGMDLPLQGGRCESVTALLHEHSVLYQRHDLTRLTGPVNPGHHATLAFPAREGAGRLSFSPFTLARTYFEPTERPESGGRSRLRPDAEITDLRAVPCVDGSTTDLTTYPARRGFEDTVILCTDPTLELAWSAVTFPEAGFVWFALRNPVQLTCTLLWFSNGGRDYAPWNGRHVNAMGIEDMTGYFQMGLAASRRTNALSGRGIRTYLEPDETGAISIPYIQGVARVPEGFDRVATIERASQEDRVRLVADSDLEVTVPCDVDFLGTGELWKMPLPRARR